MKNDLDSINLGYIFLGCYIIVGVLPLAIWNGIILKNDWKSIYLVKRRKMIVLLMFCEICIIQFIFLPILMTKNILQRSSNTGDINIDIHSIFRYIIMSFEFLLVWPLVYISLWFLLIRFWLFYYDSKLNQFNKNKSWRMVIDPIKESTNWFVKNSRKLGNWKCLAKYTTFIGIVEGWLVIGFWYSNFIPFNVLIATLIFATTGVVFVIVAIYVGMQFKFGGGRRGYSNNKNNDNTPPQSIGKDKLGIYTELRLWIFMILFDTIVIMLIFIVADWLNASNDSFLLLRIGTATFFKQCELCLIVIVPKLLYHKRLQAIANTKNNTKQQQKLQTVTGNCKNVNKFVFGLSSKSDSNGSNADSPRSRNYNYNYGWRKIVSSYAGFEAVMGHLEREFSMETLLFIQEFVQIKNVLKEFFNDIMIEIGEKSRHQIGGTLEIQLPPSSVSTNNHHNYHGKQSPADNGIIQINSDDSECVPESIIAQKLRNTLKKFDQLQSVKNSNEHENVDIKGGIRIRSRMASLTSSKPKAKIPARRNANSIELVQSDSAHPQPQSQSQPRSIKHDINGDTSTGTAAENGCNYNITQGDAVELCKAVILAFELLYNKYVDPNNAIYMINISSKNRECLKNLLDSEHREKIKNNERLRGENVINNVRSDLENRRSSQDSIDLIKWVLSTIVPNFEPSAQEISRLIDGSFSRFKLENPVLYHRLCGLCIITPQT